MYDRELSYTAQLQSIQKTFHRVFLNLETEVQYCTLLDELL